MIKIENVEVMGWEAAIRDMRNPLNSWEKSDSGPAVDCGRCGKIERDGVCTKENRDCMGFECFWVGPNDLNLMKRLRNAGTDHRKFMRMITVYVDITAPLYWWKEFKTYRTGRRFGDNEPGIIDDGYLEYDIEMNSCSTIHKIADKEFTLEDFSHEHLGFQSTRVLKDVIKVMNDFREEFLKDHEKDNWWQMIQLLPSSYNQRRTVMLNYEVLANMYKSRKNHKLDEWHTLCEWIKGLPYSELITGIFDEPEAGKNEV